MKIKEVLLKEFDDGGFNPMGDVTTGMPSASPTAVAAPAPAQAGQAKWPTTKAEIIAFQKANKLKPDGMIGKNTMAALQKSGATPPPGFKPVGNKAPAAKPTANKPNAAPAAPNAAAPAGQPTTVTNPAQATQADPDGTMSDRGKVDAMAGADASAAQNQTSNYTGQDQRTANARQDDQASDQATAAQTQTSNYTGVDQRTANARDATAAPPVQGYAGQQAQVPTFGQEDPARLQQLAGMNQTSNYTGQDQRTANARDDGQAAQPAPRDASTVPPAALGQRTTPDVSPDTGLSTAPKPVTTGTGGKTNMVTGSDDEMAWRSKQTGIVDVTKYPGPGNWDPKTGRSKKDIEQGQKNLDRVKNFFGFGKKEQPAAPAAPAQSGQAAQPGQGQQPGGYGKFSEESAILRKLAGLK